jgi:hypothetical protein
MSSHQCVDSNDRKGGRDDIVEPAAQPVITLPPHRIAGNHYSADSHRNAAR